MKYNKMRYAKKKKNIQCKDRSRSNSRVCQVCIYIPNLGSIQDNCSPGNSILYEQLFFLTFSSHLQRVRLYTRLSKSYLYRGHSHRTSVLKGVLQAGLRRQP